MSETHPQSHRLDRRFVLFLACFYAAWSLRVVLLMPVDAYIENEWIQQCWSQGLRLTIWVLPLLIYIKKTETETLVQFLRLNTFPQGKSLLAGSGIITGFLCLCVMSALFLQGGSISNIFDLTPYRWGMLLTTMSFICIVEEIFYRGFVFRKLREISSFHKANLITTILFLLIHMPGWLYMQGPHWGLISLGAGIVIVGWVLGWLVEITNSLWPPIFLHVLNNLASVLLLP
ncbi:MAG TPA: CPBP family intramembrane metalloprotease [Candidatus Hydrogenedentes bacterium]|nr:CPBP family intramembrane metalloprotease [Candidatus Hydrogenedentota bacterium]